MKPYTDIEQSKKLAEILSIDSADMFYNEEPDETYPKDTVDTKYPMVIREEQKHYLEEYGIPCWSLAALLNVLDFARCDIHKDIYGWKCYIQPNDFRYDSNWRDNPVDACVEVICKRNDRLDELRRKIDDHECKNSRN